MEEVGGGGRGEEGEGMEFRVEAAQVPRTFSSVLSQGAFAFQVQAVEQRLG